MAILEVRDLDAGYGEVQIVWGARLALEAGRITALVGSNGAGKTTLLRAVLGQVRPGAGRVCFQGADVTALPPHAKAELGLVLVPEGRQLFTDMTVRENLELGATPRRARAVARRNLDRVYGLFPRLCERLDQKAGTLSGGEQQMLALGRGLMSEPVVLLIDELSLGLAPVLALALFSALCALRRQGLTILLVEQNVRLALQASDDAYVLADGRIRMGGRAAAVAGDEGVRRAYLGL